MPHLVLGNALGVAVLTQPKEVIKSGAVVKAVLASIVLEEDGPIRAARGGGGSRDIRRANHPAKGPAPPEIIVLSVPVGFILQKKKNNRRRKKKKGEMNKGGPPFSSARNGHGNVHLTWRHGGGACWRAFFVCVRHVHSS